MFIYISNGGKRSKRKQRKTKEMEEKRKYILYFLVEKRKLKQRKLVSLIASLDHFFGQAISTLSPFNLKVKEENLIAKKPIFPCYFFSFPIYIRLEAWFLQKILRRRAFELYICTQKMCCVGVSKGFSCFLTASHNLASWERGGERLLGLTLFPHYLMDG